LRRGSGREDGSKELLEKRREASGHKLKMPRIFGFHMGFDEKTADTLAPFFLSLGALQWGHTHTSAQNVL